MKTRYKILSVIVVIGAAAALMHQTPQQKEAKYLKRGNALFEQDEFDKARVEYKNAAKAVPTDPEVNYRIGLVDEIQGNFRNAFVNFSVAEKEDAHFHAASLKVAQYYIAAEEYDQALKRIDAVLTETPDDAEAHAMHAAVILRQKDLPRAEKEARLALEKDPNNVTAYSVLIGIYVAEKDTDKAGQAADEGIAHNPKDVSLLLLKAHIYQEPLNLPKIKEVYEAIFKLKPKATQFRISLAATFIQAGKKDEAEAVLRDSIAALPDDWDLKRQLVLFLDKEKGADAAEAEIRDEMKAHPENDDLYFWLADLYVKHNNVDKAVGVLEQIVSKDKSDKAGLSAQTTLARINFTKGNKELAQKMADAVLSKAPGNSEALYIRASLEADQGLYDKAVTDLRAIIRDNPKAKDALGLLGEILLLQGHTDLAIDTLNQLVEADPANSAAQVRLAQMYNASGNGKRAVEMLKNVTSNDPKYAIGWESLARVYISNKDMNGADEAIKKLDALDGQHMTAEFLKAQIAAANGKREDAINGYINVISADPASPLSQHALTSMLQLSRNQEELEETTKYIASLKTDNVYISTLLGECYIRLGKNDLAIASFEKAIAAGADEAPYLDLAAAHLGNKNSDKALEVLDKAIAKSPTDARAYLMKASVFGAQGHQQEAIDIYAKILEHNPQLDTAANNMAALIADYAYTDADQLDKAEQAAVRFANSGNPRLLDTLGWVYYREGKLDQAALVMAKAAAVDKAPPEIHYHYGAVLAKQGKKDEAKAELQKATVKDASYTGLEEAQKLLSTL